MDQSCEAVHSEAADKHLNVTDRITSLPKLLTTTNKPLYKANNVRSHRVYWIRGDSLIIDILCVRNIVFLKFWNYNCCNNWQPCMVARRSQSQRRVLQILEQFHRIVSGDRPVTDLFIMPPPLGGGIKRWCCLTSVYLSDVCLSRTSGLSREQRGLGRLRLAQR